MQAELRNMTRGDKTPEKGPSLTFLAPVRLAVLFCVSERRWIIQTTIQMQTYLIVSAEKLAFCWQR